jgi:hypothetical protein
VPNGTRQCDGPGVSWDIVVDAMNIVKSNVSAAKLSFSISQNHSQCVPIPSQQNRIGA